LVAIVIAAHLFCNALEHLGEKLGIADGVTGSIFAAVATALPETIIPILALLNFDASQVNTHNNHEIGLGAILGAPLMLSTLSLFVMAVSVIKKRGILGRINPEFSTIRRDLQFFLFSYSLAFVAIFVQKSAWHSLLNGMIATGLGLTYFVYVLLTIKESKQHAVSGNATSASEPLFLSSFNALNKIFKLKENLLTIIIQLVIALIILVYFANLFIGAVSFVASNYHISAFLLSLFIIPVATELPEKVNSIIWLSRNKDTLAIGNITGAMMFQGSLLPIIGILFTNWSFDNLLPVLGICITFIATLWFYFNIRRKQLFVWQFGVNGLLYLIYLLLALFY
jgi:cation:H+ antiporter